MQKNPRLLSAHLFDYELPAQQIALFPLQERDHSQLLVYENGRIKDHIYHELPSLLTDNCRLIFNQTKVIPARILFEKSSGGVIEIFCLAPDTTLGEMSMALQQTATVRMQCLVGGASKWKAGITLEMKREELTLSAMIVNKEVDHFLIEFHWSPAHFSFAALLELFGQMPLPPYLKRKVVTADQDRYQTVYAQQEGSVAAPTAGLHFTPSLLRALQEKGIQRDFLTLQVGAGTFKPVKASIMAEHLMHAEWIELELDFLKRWLQSSTATLVAVGTTSLRSLESAYWIGVKICTEKHHEIPALGQWECYELAKHNLTLETALESLIHFMEEAGLQKLITQTSLMIGPGYTFKTAQGLLTNFHQPRSTLLLLVAAFVGEDWKQIYNHALRQQYRMLSYGDGSLLWRNNESGFSSC